MQRITVPIVRAAVALILAAIISGACAGGGGSAPASATKTLRPGSFERPIVLAAVPFSDAGKLSAGVTAIAAAMERSTGLKWKVAVPTSYAATIEALCAGQVDIAFLAPLAYALAADKACADVMLASKFGNDVTYKGQILVRTDSGITGVLGLKGKKFAFVDPLSASGTLYPSLLVKQKGGEEPRTFFKETVFAGGHDKAILALYNGSVDGAASYIDARDLLEATFPDIKQKTKVIDTTPDIPNDNVSASRRLPAEVKQQIADALFAFSITDAGKKQLKATFGIDGYQPVGNDFYESVREAVRLSGADLETFAKRTAAPTPSASPAKSP